MSENITLPPLSDDTVARMERAVFDRISREPRGRITEPARPRSRRGWMTGLAVAAAFAVGALVAPPLLNGLSGGGAASVSDQAPASDGSPESADGDSGGAVAAPRDDAKSQGLDALVDGVDDTREIITTAEVTLRVSDVERAADALSALAVKHGGYVESASLGLDPDGADIAPERPREPGTGRISIRVPASDLEKVMASVGEDGEVLHSSIDRQDVTSTAVDLRARIDAARTSVRRLTELMGKSGSVGDLIAAESALSERQAQLESYEQELKHLDEQVAMSTISFQLTEKATASEADPAGFGDGLLAGWNGLITALNGLVVALGFLLPWLGIAAIALLVFWLIRRRRRPAAD